MKKILLGLLLGSTLFANSINIAVAANVSYAIEELINEFNKLYPNTKVNVTLGSSGKLTAQIKNGAPYDLFMSANMKYPHALYQENIAITKPKIYAKGSLSLLSTTQRSFHKGIYLIDSMLIKKIAMANPKTAPYGKATLEALKNMNLYEKIQDKLIYGESISQTVSYALIAADVGFIAKSSLYSPTMKKYKKNVHWIDVDSKLYTPIDQGIVMLKNKKGVEEFYNFILNSKAKTILKNYGYLIP